MPKPSDQFLLSVLLLLLLLVCLPHGVPVTPCPRARTAERIAGPVACRPEWTETYISLPGRLTSGTSESRAKFTTTKARASNSVTKAPHRECGEIETNE